MRPTKRTPEAAQKVLHAVELVAQGFPVSAVADAMGMHTSNLYMDLRAARVVPFTHRDYIVPGFCGSGFVPRK